MRQLGLFAKYWEPGQVKTRLAMSIGEQAASRLYREFLATTVQTFQSFPAERILAYWPLEKRLEFKQLTGSRWNLAPQTAGDLGARMQAFLAGGLTAGREQIVLIGADSPTLSPETVQLAFESLDQHDVVIGPARDGGYYLIGCRRKIPGIFEDIHWGSADVFQQTIRKLDSSPLSYTILPEWYDVDRLDDLVTLHHELTQPALKPSWPATLVETVCQVMDEFGITSRSEP